MNQYDIASEIFKEIGAEASEKFLDYLEFIEASEQEMQIAAAMVAGLDKERCREQVGSKTVASMMKKVPDILFYMDEFFVSSAFTKIFRKNNKASTYIQSKLSLRFLAIEILDNTSHISALKLLNKTFSYKDLNLKNKYNLTYERLLRGEDKSYNKFLSRLEELKLLGALSFAIDFTIVAGITNRQYIKSNGQVERLFKLRKQTIQEILHLDLSQLLNSKSREFQILTFDSLTFTIVFDILYRQSKSKDELIFAKNVLSLVQTKSSVLRKDNYFIYYYALIHRELNQHEKSIQIINTLDLKKATNYQYLVVIEVKVFSLLKLHEFDKADKILTKNLELTKTYNQRVYRTLCYYHLLTLFILGKKINKAIIDIDFSSQLKLSYLSIEIIKCFYIPRDLEVKTRLLENLRKQVRRSVKDPQVARSFLTTISLLKKHYRKHTPLNLDLLTAQFMKTKYKSDRPNQGIDLPILLLYPPKK